MPHSRFIVSDSNGCDKYIVTGQSGSPFQKMAISSVQGTVLVNIRVAPLCFFSAFAVSQHKDRFLMVCADKHAKHFRFYGINWVFSLSSDRRSFEISDTSGTPVMLQSAENLLSKGYYELDIFCQSKELFCVAAAVCANTYAIADSVLAATV